MNYLKKKELLKMYKKIIFFILLSILITSCADDWASVKRGLTGEKKQSSDEFFVKKKDPLILPPDYENLPVPTDAKNTQDFSKSFKKQVTKNSENENSNQSTGSAESSILKKIKNR